MKFRKESLDNKSVCTELYSLLKTKVHALYNGLRLRRFLRSITSQRLFVNFMYGGVQMWEQLLYSSSIRSACKISFVLKCFTCNNQILCMSKKEQNQHQLLCDNFLVSCLKDVRQIVLIDSINQGFNIIGSRYIQLLTCVWLKHVR